MSPQTGPPRPRWRTHPDLMPTLFFGEEYLLALAYERLSELALTIKEAPSIYDGDGLALRLQLRLAQTLRRLHDNEARVL